MMVYSSSFSRSLSLGYDVLLLATPERHMTGLDMSATCVDKLNKVGVLSCKTCVCMDANLLLM